MTSPRLKAAVKALEKMPDAPSRTLARLLHESRPKLFPTVEAARDSIRSLRGNGGKNKRRHKTGGTMQFRRPNFPAGYVHKIPEPHAESWEPLLLEGARCVLSLSDIHVPYHDVKALESAIKTGKKHKPDVVLINGDLIDFYQLSRFIRDPERRDPAREIRESAELLLWIGKQFPKARLVWKLGNHEERWASYVWQNAPILWQINCCRLSEVMALQMAEITGKNSYKLEDYGWEIEDQRRPIHAGKLPILHGHELPRGLATPVNQARGAYLRAQHTILVGHGHRSSQHVEPNMYGKEVSCWSQGCLCGLNPYYARVNKWNQGFAVVKVATDGEQFDVTNYRMDREYRVRVS